MDVKKVYILLFLAVVLVQFTVMPSIVSAQEEEGSEDDGDNGDDDDASTTVPSSPRQGKAVSSPSSNAVKNPVETVTAGVEYANDDGKKTDEIKPGGSAEGNNSTAPETTTSDEILDEGEEGDEEEATEEPQPKCFGSVLEWKKNLLRRIQTTNDNIKYQLVAMAGPSARKDLLRDGHRNLRLLQKIVQAAGSTSTQPPAADDSDADLDEEKQETTTAPTTTKPMTKTVKRDEDAIILTLTSSETNFNRIGWLIYRGKNGWQFKECCYKEFTAMCGQKSDKFPV